MSHACEIAAGNSRKGEMGKEEGARRVSRSPYIYLEDRRGNIPPGFNSSTVAEGQRQC